MSSTRNTAILDVDGTLLPGALGVVLLEALVERGLCDEPSAGRVFQSLADYRAGVIEFRAMASRAYSAYAEALEGREVEVVAAVAREVWATRRAELFAFVPELLACLRSAGYRTMLISGSPQEMIGLVAESLDIDAAYGAVFGRHDGRYTGRVDLSSGMPGEKARIFAAAEADHERRLPTCLAIGDSLTDVALFERVGLPLVFEPAADLAELAAARGWPIATRDDVLDHTRSLLARALGASSEAGDTPAERALQESTC